MTEAFKEFGVQIKVRPRQVSISNYYHGVQTNEKTVRSNICGWNGSMARRLGAYISNFREDFSGFVTLTYPDVYPNDGKVVKAHWRAFVERLRRKGWFEDYSLVWFLEFQERGAPHFHFLCTGWIEKKWVAEAWAEITDGNVQSCSRVEALRNPEAAGCYAMKYAMKSEQKVVPEGFKNVGRFWGCSGKKIHKGLPRQPSVAAAIPGRSCGDVLNKIKEIETISGIKVFHHDYGAMIYGSRRTIREVYRILCLKNVITNRVGLRPDTSTLRTLDG